MNDVARLVLEAWEKLGPGIMGDSDELNRRLARRRRAILTRPPRAWCLAVRACDRRITPAHWVISPEHAMDWDHPAHPYEVIEHEVVIGPHALRKYCRAVRTDSWGEQVDEVCAKLGASRSHVLNARWAGVFTERFVKGLGGKHCRHPIPLIHSWKTLDPSSGRHFSRCDPLWGALWEFLADGVPDGFEQSVVRRPVFRRLTGKIADPTGEIYKDERQFWGWRWVCPGCGKEVRTIYYPFAAETVFDFLGYDPSRAKSCRRQSKKYLPCDVDEVERPAGTFACKDCHRVRNTSRVNSEGWNQVVSHLTRGMLYGHEVERPQWYERQRKNARSRRLGRVAGRREAVFVRLMNGWSYEQIARELMMSMGNVTENVRVICKQEGVKNRRELAAKLGWKHEQPLNKLEKQRAVAREKRERAMGLILEGLSREEIARRMGLGRVAVKDLLARIYKKHGLGKGEGKRGLGRKFGVELSRYGRGVVHWKRKGVGRDQHQCA